MLSGMDMRWDDIFYSMSTQRVLVAWCSEGSVADARKVMVLFDAMLTSIVRSDDYITSLPRRWIND
jgi:hypothetical protein